MENKIRNLSYIKKLLLSFFLVLFVPLTILGVSFYIFFYKQSVSDLKNEKTLLCKDMETSAESLITAVEDELLELNMSLPTSIYAYEKDAMRIFHVASQMVSLTKKYDFLKSVYCYDARTGKIISSATGVYLLGEFYDTGWYTIARSDMTRVKRLPVRKDVNSFLVSKTPDNYKAEDVITVLVGSMFDYQFVANISLSKLNSRLSEAYSFDGESSFLKLAGGAETTAKGGAETAAKGSAETAAKGGTDGAAKGGAEGETAGNASEGNANEAAGEATDETAGGASNGTSGGFPEKDGIAALSDKNDYVTVEGSIYFGLIDYCAYYNESLLLHGYTYYGRYFTILLIILSLSMAALTVKIARQLYSPVGRLYGLVRRNMERTSQCETLSAKASRDELSVLSEAFKSLNEEKEASSQQAFVYRSAMASASLYMFLEGNMTEDKFFEINSGIAEKDFRLCIVGIENTDESAAGKSYKMNLTGLLSTYLSEKVSAVVAGLGGNNIGIMLLGEYAVLPESSIILIENTLSTLAGEHGFYAAFGLSRSSVSEVRDDYPVLSKKVANAFFFGNNSSGEKANVLSAGDTVSGKDAGRDSGKAVGRDAGRDAGRDSGKDAGKAANILMPGSSVPEKLPEENIGGGLINYETGLLSAILRGESKTAMSLSEELFRLLSGASSPELVRSSCTVVLLSLEKELKFASRLNINPNDAFLNLGTFDECRFLFENTLSGVLGLFENTASADSEYCRNAKEFLDNHYMENLDMLRVCDALNISYPYLSRIFKETYKVTLSDYLNSLRIQKGVYYLETTQLTVNEIAEKVGYNNIQSFQRFFKKIVGITPGDYRKLHKSNAV